MPDAMCLTIDANAYTYIHRRRWRTMAMEATTTTLSMPSNLKPQSQVVRHILIFRARASYWLLPLSLIIFDFGTVARCYFIFFFLSSWKKRKNRNKIQGAACWFPFSYFILSTRNACIVFVLVVLVLHSEGATFCAENFSFFWSRFATLRSVVISRGRRDGNRKCSRINASKIFITGEMMIVRFNWTPIEVQRIWRRWRRSPKFDSNEAKRIRFQCAHKAFVCVETNERKISGSRSK